jgi:hypothetical protein
MVTVKVSVPVLAKTTPLLENIYLAGKIISMHPA